MFSVADVAALAGRTVFARGQDYLDRGMVVSVARKPGGGTIVGQVRGSSSSQYVAVIEMSGSGADAKPRYGRCSCPVRLNCKHTVATLLAFLAKTSAGASPAQEWERTFATLLDPGADVGDDPGVLTAGDVRSARVTPVALQVEVEPGVVPRLALTPAIMGVTGRWMRSNISWDDIRFLGYRHGSAVPAHHVEVLQTLVGLAGAGASHYGAPKVIHADELHGSAFWAVLDDAVRTGLPIIGRDREQSAVRVLGEPVRVRLVVGQSDDGGLVVSAAGLLGADEGVDPRRTVLLGKPAVGLFTWSGGSGDVPSRESHVTLGRFSGVVDDTVRSLLERSEVLSVPADAAERFLVRVLPVLRARVDEVEVAPGIVVPDAPRPWLWLVVRKRPDHVTWLEWQWRYFVDGTVGGEPAFTVPLGVQGQDPLRDRVAEREVVSELSGLVPRLLDVLEADARERSMLVTGASRLPEEGFAPTILSGLDTARFFTDELPELEALAGVRADFGVEVVSEGAQEGVDYRFESRVDVEVSATELDDSRDWFGLGVTVRAGDQVVPFADVFSAIATGRSYLLLANGLHFKLEDSRFDRLRELIEEAKALQDSMGEGLRVSRYQAQLFEDLEQMGLLGAQAQAWRDSVSALTSGGQVESLPVPVGVDAELRPYQQAGFEWLAFLAANRLGGVLADDMGLGKTLQGLALVQHLHEQAQELGQGRPGPVLIVAPTSVVGNWIGETAKFTPGLRAVAITSGSGRGRASLTERIAGADVVVTSYALFRNGFEEYDDVPWAALILDEAQFIKNRQSVAYRCARLLGAPVKIAMTGTPLENNLMELWSILSVVSPGLFPNPQRFNDYYARPIERNRDSKRLEQLRKRIGPFMLRRTKEAVAADLPAKQEQVMDVELNARHRKVYDRYLQRERAKVLGVIDELDEHRFEVFRSLTLLRQASLDVGLVDGEHEGIPSSKLDVLFEMLEDILAEDHSVLIFSQFTRFLGRVRDRLDAQGVAYSYLDGSTRRRSETIERFTSGETRVFLISLKAGGFGLNLTAADYCILLDPWWNPAAEAQAVDRAHRIGQTRPVNVYRLVSANTIEEKVMALKEGKSSLFTSVLEGGEAQTRGFTADDVRELLR